MFIFSIVNLKLKKINPYLYLNHNKQKYLSKKSFFIVNYSLQRILLMIFCRIPFVKIFGLYFCIINNSHLRIISNKLFGEQFLLKYFILHKSSSARLNYLTRMSDYLTFNFVSFQEYWFQ